MTSAGRRRPGPPDVGELPRAARERARDRRQWWRRRLDAPIQEFLFSAARDCVHSEPIPGAAARPSDESKRGSAPAEHALARHIVPIAHALEASAPSLPDASTRAMQLPRERPLFALEPVS